MKKLFILLVACSCFSIYSSGNIYKEFYNINKIWEEQKDIVAVPNLSTTDFDERDWIQLHLLTVEQTLRNSNVAHLSLRQQLNRTKALNHLHEYALKANFPINDRYDYWTPIFIDKYNNFCAVGYLVKATGYEQVSRMIAAKTNLAYVREMNYPELNDWANDYGFTTDELAWIQPGYPGGGTRTAEAIGKGTNGEVTELYVSASGTQLFVGGSFTEVDSSIHSSGIAYVTENNGIYTWHGLGAGINGTVNAIQEYNGKLFAGGNFNTAGGNPVDNIAYWDGSNWNNAGCFYGTVKDLIVYNNELYAVGDFDVCAALAEVNFTKWDTTYNMWMQVDGGLSGHINTIEVIDTTLLLGGRFLYQNDTVGIIRWTASNSYQLFTKNITNIDVTDIAKYKDTVYAIGNRLNMTDTSLIYALRGNEWKVLLTNGTNSFSYKSFWLSNYSKGFNSFCVDNDTVILGGDFVSLVSPGLLPYFYNLYANHISISVDSAINKMVVFNNELIFGGKFTIGENGFGWGGSYYTTTLNHIGKKGYLTSTSTHEILDKELFTIYPNPATSKSIIHFQNNNFNAHQWRLINTQGQIIKKEKITTNPHQLQLPELPTGMYHLQLINKYGSQLSKNIMIQ